MLMEAPEIAKYFTVSEAAKALDWPEARVRDLQRKGFAPSLSKGRLQFSRSEVARLFVLDRLQGVLGQTAIATAIALALDPAGLEDLLNGRRLKIEALVASPDGIERTFRVDINPVSVDQLRERMAAVSQ
jgi:hypothetical protein